MFVVKYYLENGEYGKFQTDDDYLAVLEEITKLAKIKKTRLTSITHKPC